MKILLLFASLSLAAIIGISPVISSSSAAGKAIPKAKGGYTVAELHAKKAELKGKKVAVRGKVVKVNAQIMGKNWLHLQDGTGKAGTNDITATSAGSANVGDVVLATCTLSVDKDFGAGYFYSIILEDCTLGK